MHWENLRAWARAWACCAGVGWPPFGNKCRQSLLADWKLGELGLMPLPCTTPCELGSGKFGTPWVCMQCEKASIWVWLPPAMANCWPGPGPPLGPALDPAPALDPEPAVDLGLPSCEPAPCVVVVALSWATPASWLGLPPQAASSRAPPDNTLNRATHRGLDANSGTGVLVMRMVISRTR
jgi:hypothetical protein